MNYLKVLLFFFICQIGHGQQTVVKGSIVDSETKNGLTDATITIIGTPLSQIANSNGDFYFENVPVGEQQFLIELEGYQQLEFTVLVKAASIANIDQIALKKGKSTSKKNVAKGTGISGVVLDQNSGKPVANAQVVLIGNETVVKTDKAGEFILATGIYAGSQSLKIAKEGYDDRILDLFVISGKMLRIDNIRIGVDTYDLEHITTTTFATDELYTESERIRNSARLYENSSDPFLNIAATEFSPVFFQLRGQQLDQSAVLINGVSMIQPTDNKPDWDVWDGLTEATRNSAFYLGLEPAKNTFGNLMGTLEIDTRADTYTERGKISYGNSNRRFSHEGNAYYSCGLSAAGLAYVVALSGRYSQNGYYDGTPYEGVNGLVSVSKRLTPTHSLHFTGIFNSIYRGKYAANTQEVFSLKNYRYNPYWGLQSGEERRAKDRYSTNPILLLNYKAQLAQNTTLQATVAYQFSSQLDRQLDFGGTSLNADGVSYATPNGIDPNPSAINKLPSAFLPDPVLSASAAQEFRNDGQVDWEALYRTNNNNASGNATYAFYENREDRKAFTATTSLQTKIGTAFSLNGTVAYEHQTSDYYASILDLLVGDSYLDIQFNGTTALQSDVQNTNREVGTGERFRYNYKLNASILKSFVQATYTASNWQAHMGLKLTNTSYAREGLFQNQNALENSLGKGMNQQFFDFGIKAGVQYRFNTAHQLQLNTGFLTNAPSWNTAFPNARVSDTPIQNGIDPESEKSFTMDLGYTFTTNALKTRITGFYTATKDAASSTPFGATSVNGQEAASIITYLHAMQRIYLGMEFGIDYSISKSMSILGAASIGNYRYGDDPQLSYILSGTEVLNLGAARLKDNHLANGPQKVISLGLEHQNQHHWWVRIMGNFFADNYVALNPYSRTSSFLTDSNGAAVSSPEFTDQLLTQEKLSDHFQLNLSGGKFWQLKNKKQQIGFKTQITNLLSQQHFLGGYETTTNQQYQEVLADRRQSTPTLGNAYWAGYDLSFYASLYFRF